MFHRRRFLAIGLVSATQLAVRRSAMSAMSMLEIPEPKVGEDLIQFVHRARGGWDQTLYRQLLGAANAFKEGDEIVGVAAADDNQRAKARQLLSQTTVHQIDAHPPFDDSLLTYISKVIDRNALAKLNAMTLLELKTFLLEKTEAEIHSIRDGLSSDVIGCVVRLMSNEELIQVGAKVFNPLPDSQPRRERLHGSTHSA
jgi:ethanolamine ammonia-lyase large subunit